LPCKGPYIDFWQAAGKKHVINQSKKFSGRPDKSVLIFRYAMYKIGYNLALLALGTVLVMTAVALVPRANAQRVDLDIANVDCNQEQKQKQDSEQTQVNEQSNNQSSDETLLGEQKSDQNTEQDDEQNSLLGSIDSLLSGNQNSEGSTDQENEQDTDQDAENNNEQSNEQSGEAYQDCNAVSVAPNVDAGGIL
jgi:hypothetical protein